MDASQSITELIKVRRAGQITLPAAIREAFNLREGDYLEVRATEHSILLKPVDLVARPLERRIREAGQEMERGEDMDGAQASGDLREAT